MAPHKPKESELTQERLKKFLHYDSETGVFTWIEKTAIQISVGDIAGSTHSNGYRIICVLSRHYPAHRLAWLYVYGNWPQYEIDHINRNRSDNRISNLRDVPREINQRNANRRVDNTTGIKGVSFNYNNYTWRARITVDGKTIALGSFPFKEQAIEARRKAETKHGFLGE